MTEVVVYASRRGGDKIDRWSPSRTPTTDVHLSLLFSIRSCGGAKLARLELIEGLKASIRRFIVTRKGDELSFDYTIAMRPKSWDHVEIATR
jgi:cytochrome P450